MKTLILKLALVALVGASGYAWLTERPELAVGCLFVAGALWVRLLYRRFGPRMIRDWRDAEYATARWLKRAGCRRVVLTGGSADGGIDVITTESAPQVKHTAKRVGRPAVQQTVGAALTLDKFPALFSTSGFTAPAVAYADEHDVALLDLDLDGAAHRVNSAARGVGTRTRRLLPRR